VPSSKLSTYLPPVLVLLAAVTVAVCLYRDFLHNDRFLWDNPTHDRNAHYLTILKLATSLRQGRLLDLGQTLLEARVWPPLHGILGAITVLIGGCDYRLAVLPSLAGWVVAVLFGFLVARRSVRQGGNLAGLVAALFLLASPAHRAFALDIMLESLGAALSLVVLYCYLVAVQSPWRRIWAGRFLGIALTALFVEKYNYWLLVVAALLASELLVRPGVVAGWLRAARGRIRWRSWPDFLLRRPLAVLAGAVVLLTIPIFLHGDQPWVWGQYQLSLYPPHNFYYAAYVLLFLEGLSWWRQQGRQQVRRLDPLLAAVVRWHLYFLALWFLLPKHISYFLTYLGPANAHENQHFQVVQGVRDYARWLVEDYHLGLAAMLTAAGLAGVGLVSRRSWQAGGRAVVLFLLLSAVLTVLHPNHKGRNLHSWLAAEWALAGVGAAALVYGRATARRAHLRPWAAGVCVAALACLLSPAGLKAGHALEGGPHPHHPSWLDATDAYQGELDEPHRALLLTTASIKPQTQWTYLERHGSFDRLEQHWWGFAELGGDNRQGFLHWLKTTSCDTVVCLDGYRKRPGEEPAPETLIHAELIGLLPQQKRFRLVKERDFPALGLRVQVWRRPEASGR
jgi:hypothetical protein